MLSICASLILTPIQISLFPHTTKEGIWTHLPAHSIRSHRSRLSIRASDQVVTDKVPTTPSIWFDLFARAAYRTQNHFTYQVTGFSQKDMTQEQLGGRDAQGKVRRKGMELPCSLDTLLNLSPVFSWEALRIPRFPWLGTLRFYGGLLHRHD